MKNALVLLRLAALAAFLAVAMGAVVCATNSGAGCPTWPGCHPGQVVPRWQLSPVVEFSHRVVAITAGPLLLAAAIMVTRSRAVGWGVRALPWLAVGLAVVSGAVGRLVVLTGVPRWLGALDLSCALTTMVLISVAASFAGLDPALGRDRASSSSGRLAATTVPVLIALYVTGILVAGRGSYTRCVGWPLWERVPGDLHPGWQSLRLVLAGVAAVLVLVTVATAVTTPTARRWGLVLALLATVEAAVGLALRSRGPHHGGLPGVYSVVAVAMLWCLAPLAAMARTPVPAADDMPRNRAGSATRTGQ